MRKAGGIIALIAGVFAVLAAIVTLAIGGLGSAFAAHNAGTVVWLGWGGVLFSFLVIVLGAVCTGATSRVPAILLIVCAIFGAVLGGTLVALFMALALLGGLVAVFATGPTNEVSSTSGHSFKFASNPPDLSPEGADAIISAYVAKTAGAKPASYPLRTSSPTPSTSKPNFGRRC